MRLPTACACRAARHWLRRAGQAADGRLAGRRGGMAGSLGGVVRDEVRRAAPALREMLGGLRPGHRPHRLGPVPGGCPAAMPAPIVDDMRTAHDIIAMLPDDIHAEVVEGEVIVNAATPAGRHAKIVLAVRRAFARHGIDNLFQNTTLLVEHDEAEYVPDLARWPEHLIDGDTREFPAAECAFALEVVSGDRPGRRQRDYQKAPGYARGG